MKGVSLPVYKTGTALTPTLAPPGQFRGTSGGVILMMSCSILKS